jgi:hypothetical protein
VAWWRWRHDDRTRYPDSRAALLLIGLSCASAVVAVFWISAVTRWAVGHGTPSALMVYELGVNLAFFLMLVALSTTAFGKGRGRLLALAATFLNFFLWLPIAF